MYNTFPPLNFYREIMVGAISILNQNQLPELNMLLNREITSSYISKLAILVSIFIFSGYNSFGCSMLLEGMRTELVHTDKETNHYHLTNSNRPSGQTLKGYSTDYFYPSGQWISLGRNQMFNLIVQKRIQHYLSEKQSIYHSKVTRNLSPSSPENAYTSPTIG